MKRIYDVVGDRYSNRLADYSFDYGDFRFICADSGPHKMQYTDITIYILGIPITIPIPNPSETISKNQLDGLTDTQWNWIQSEAQSQSHVFFFTHGRIVGGGAEQNSRLAFHTADFVGWADGANVEAVFCGHTHGTVGFGGPPPYVITTSEMDNPNTFDTSPGTIPFSWATVYIETENST